MDGSSVLDLRTMSQLLWFANSQNYKPIIVTVNHGIVIYYDCDCEP